MKPREGDMMLSQAIPFLEAIEHSVGNAGSECDCEYCMSDKMYAIERAKKIQEALKSMGWEKKSNDQ